MNVIKSGTFFTLGTYIKDNFRSFDRWLRIADKLRTKRPASTGIFLPNYKYFDQLLRTVRNKTAVLNLVFKEFLRTSIPPLISVLYAKGYHDFPLKNFCLKVLKIFVEKPFCVSENLCYRKMLAMRGAGITSFRKNCFVSQYRIIS